MRLVIGRRASFFAIVAVISALLVPVTPSNLRWVAWFCAGLSLLWAIVMAVEHLSRARPRRKERRRAPSATMTPFDPPPARR